MIHNVILVTLALLMTKCVTGLIPLLHKDNRIHGSRQYVQASGACESYTCADTLIILPFPYPETLALQQPRRMGGRRCGAGDQR